MALACCLTIQGETAEESRGQPAPVIQLFADWSQEWQDGEEHVALFRGNCRVIQGSREYSADKMVAWVQTSVNQSNSVHGSANPSTVLAIYLEDHVRCREDQEVRTGANEFVVMSASGGITLTVKGRQTQVAGTHDPLYQRAMQRRQAGARDDLSPTAYTVDSLAGRYQVLALPEARRGYRRVRWFPRGAQPFNIQSFPAPDTSPPLQIVMLTGGVNLLIEGVGGWDVIDLSADRAVVWMSTDQGEFSTDSLQSGDSPYEVYLEGNIVVRQGNNLVRADRAYYDAREQRALLIQAELQAYLPDLEATVRVRAERLRQLSPLTFHAQQAWITTSQYGKPGYRVEASDVFLEPRMGTPWSPPRIDPQTGQVQPTLWATVQNGTLLIDEFPVIAIPRISVPAEDPGIPIDTLTFRQDRIFGTQVRTRWDGFKVLGWEKTPQCRWNLELDYLSERGPFLGTMAQYQGADLRGWPQQGELIASYVHDDGEDNLGLDRRQLAPPDNDRGRLLWRHRQFLTPDLQMIFQTGYESDRNYVEQYYEQEFDTGLDRETSWELKQNGGAAGWALLVRPQINRFENTTQWLPRADFTWLGEPLLGGLITWSTHNYVSYASLRRSAVPSDPADTWSPIPYIVNAEGFVGMTRHALQAPLALGPIMITPYALGEAAAWGEDLTGTSTERLYGRTGIHTALTLTKIDPYITSDIFNLNGLAHKMTLEAHYAWAESTRDLTVLPQYNELFDDAQERFQQRFLWNTYGGVLPNGVDPRFYAVRSAVAVDVTAPYHELVDDQQVLQLMWRHRWQTHAGPIDRPRIRDWMILDLGINYYPRPSRDNYGEPWGLFQTRYAWHVGERTSLLASSTLDFFGEAPRQWNLGLLSQRNLRGSMYLGFRSLEAGDFHSQILTASYIYKMSDKWMSRFTTAYDVAENQNRGQSLTITRIGEFLLLHVGFHFDASKNNVGAAIAVEPRLGNASLPTGLFDPILNP
ncbi:MAG: hypothetical protein KatS3mg113_0606 [Planctomycetaceae bacterium]|nr:MAG: hypothetical protein KatS3mg113_0606 [Planctomycetaceae bacterium]